MDCKTAKTKLLEATPLPKEYFRLPEDLRQHVWHCSDCRNFYQGLVDTAEVLHKMSEVHPPQNILNNYMADLDRKIRMLEASEGNEQENTSSVRWEFLRPVFSLAAIVLVIFSIWWFALRQGQQVDPENLATDSLDYYIESFTEEAAQNSVASVKGFEYEWAYNINIRK